MGFTLDEIALANTPASFEPALDYVVTKIARFPFDKFDKASRLLSTQMKATGEVMGGSGAPSRRACSRRCAASRRRELPAA